MSTLDDEQAAIAAGAPQCLAHSDAQAAADETADGVAVSPDTCLRPAGHVGPHMGTHALWLTGWEA